MKKPRCSVKSPTNAIALGSYRFLDNDRVREAEILAGHFQATRQRFEGVAGPVLLLHDTSEFSYTRENTEAIGMTHKVAKGHKDKKGSGCTPSAASSYTPAWPSPPRACRWD